MLRFEAAVHGNLGPQNEPAVAWLIHRLGLQDFGDADWNDLSSGYKTRFELARALLRDPHLLILDEPLAHLDPSIQSVFLTDLAALRDRPRNPPAIVLTSQHVQEAEGLADRLIFLRDGSVEFSGTKAELADRSPARIFELSCLATLAEITEAIRELPEVTLSVTGATFTIRAQSDTSAGSFLQRLLDAGIEPSYFRDITNSTRRLFDSDDLDG
jgi:ABC-2 type transport system ATP-binding protein